MGDSPPDPNAGTILKTTDGGTNWITNDTIPQLESVYFVNADAGYAVGSWGPVLKTTNGGTSWTAFAVINDF